MKILGVDFTSAPGARKAIAVARCRMVRGRLHLEALEALRSFDAFERLLAEPGPWIGGFDFPFGLPREMVRDLGLPDRWRTLVERCASLSRCEWRALLDGYRAGRPHGRRYAHRATDLRAGSSSPMKLVHPPVALMFHEGAVRLARSGVRVPALAEGDPERIALETYPALLAREIVGRTPYKSDGADSEERRAARRRIVRSLAFEAPVRLRRRLVEDASGDALDALLCALQAARSWQLRARNFGLPAAVDPVEGWIAGSPAAKPPSAMRRGPRAHAAVRPDTLSGARKKMHRCISSS